MGWHLNVDRHTSSVDEKLPSVMSSHGHQRSSVVLQPSLPNALMGFAMAAVGCAVWLATILALAVIEFRVDLLLGGAASGLLFWVIGVRFTQKVTLSPAHMDIRTGCRRLRIERQTIESVRIRRVVAPASPELVVVRVRGRRRRVVLWGSIGANRWTQRYRDSLIAWWLGSSPEVPMDGG
jgi:hypothetical protein